MLREALLTRGDKSALIIASKLYEKITGNMLAPATDPNTGEPYLYTAGTDTTFVSLTLHPEVIRLFDLPTAPHACLTALDAIPDNDVIDLASNTRIGLFDT